INGAITLGTLDGANIEIREEVGSESFFLFGLTADEVRKRREAGYRPRDFYEREPLLREALDLIRSGAFSRGDGELFRGLVDGLLAVDPFLVLADFAAYVACQDRIDATFRDTRAWTRASILNVARSGKFSSDRAVKEYAEQIWKVSPVVIRPGE